MQSKQDYYQSLISSSETSIIPCTSDLTPQVQTTLKTIKQLNLSQMNQDYSYLLNPFQSTTLPHPYTETEAMQSRDFDFEINRPEDQDFGNFRGVARDVGNKFQEISGIPSGEFPITYRTIENWWEFEKFNKLMDHSDLYIKGIKTWHKYTVKERVRHETYRPYWSVIPRDPMFDLHSYYHNTTLRVYRGWRNPKSTYQAYRNGRLLAYFLFGSYCLAFVSLQYYGKSRNRDTLMLINEDFWLQEEKLLLKKTRSIFGDILIKGSDMYMDLLEPFVLPLVFFNEGPAGLRRHRAELEEMNNPHAGLVYEGGKK
jgi:hypothetical protein